MTAVQRGDSVKDRAAASQRKIAEERRKIRVEKEDTRKRQLAAYEAKAALLRYVSLSLSRSLLFACLNSQLTAALHSETLAIGDKVEASPLIERGN